MKHLYIELTDIQHAGLKQEALDQGQSLSNFIRLQLGYQTITQGPVKKANAVVAKGDPYGHIIEALKSGKRVRNNRLKHDWQYADHFADPGTPFRFYSDPECYEIESGNPEPDLAERICKRMWLGATCDSTLANMRYALIKEGVDLT